MSEPDWAKLLSIIYNQTGETKFKTDSEREILPMVISEKDDIKFEPIPFKPDELKQTVDYLDRMDLVDVRAVSHREEIDEWLKSVSLAKKGFDVAHEREQNRGQKAINKDIKNLTVILALTASIQALAAVFSVKLPYQYLIALFCIIIITLIYVYDFI